jgi:hypothetical protein
MASGRTIAGFFIRAGTIVLLGCALGIEWAAAVAGHIGGPASVNWMTDTERGM